MNIIYAMISVRQNLKPSQIGVSLIIWVEYYLRDDQCSTKSQAPTDRSVLDHLGWVLFTRWSVFDKISSPYRYECPWSFLCLRIALQNFLLRIKGSLKFALTFFVLLKTDPILVFFKNYIVWNLLWGPNWHFLILPYPFRHETTRKSVQKLIGLNVLFEFYRQKVSHWNFEWMGKKLISSNLGSSKAHYFRRYSQA